MVWDQIFLLRPSHTKFKDSKVKFANHGRGHIANWKGFSDYKKANNKKLQLYQEYNENLRNFSYQNVSSAQIVANSSNKKIQGFIFVILINY